MPVHPFPKTASNQMLSEASRGPAPSALPLLLMSAAIICAGVGAAPTFESGLIRYEAAGGGAKFRWAKPVFRIDRVQPASAIQIQPIVTIDLELQ